MRFNSKVLGILPILFIFLIVISSAGAVDLINNNHFYIDVPGDSSFSQSSSADINIGDVDISIAVFENYGNNSKDINAIIYFKDYSSDNGLISDLYNDLKKDYDIVEENDNYTIFKTKNAGNPLSLNIADDVNDIISYTGDIFSSKGGNNPGLDFDGVAFEDGGLKVSGADGKNVSISTDVIAISDDSSSGEEYPMVISINGNINPEIQNGDYVIHVKNQDGNQVILVIGNNLELMKKTAETASFS